MRSILPDAQIHTKIGAVLKKELNALKQKERPELDFDGPQWAYWALLPQYSHKFSKLVDVLKDMKQGVWNKEDFALVLDALAMGDANVTPYAVEWSFMYAPSAARARALQLAQMDFSANGISCAVLATHPFPPSTRYNEMWRGFKGSVLKEKGAYSWLS